MSEPSETSGRLLTPTKQEHQPRGNTINSTSSSRTKQRKSSKSSRSLDDYSESFKSTDSHRRSGTTIKPLSGPHTSSSRLEERSTTNPPKMMSQAPSINYTRTGRISKAKKGLKVHNCECGRSYTRAEHLRRHQKNHAQEDALVCRYPDCGKTFYRLDLLHRHQERHNEPGEQSPHTPIFSPANSPEAHESSAPVAVAVSLSHPASSLPATPSYYSQQPVSPRHESASISRYTFTSFRTPRVPRTPRLPLSTFITHSSPTSSPNVKQAPYSSRHLMAQPVPVEGMASSLGWEPYSESPSYSTSSGYASPNPGHGDYSNMYANPPYSHSAIRTRTSSIASFNEPWSYTPRSPTSSASTMPYTWASNEKMPTALAYMGTSYPMPSLGISTPVDPMSGYTQFGPRTMMQRDEDESIILFPEQPYGMGQIVHTYPSEHYLNNYWRLFHPTFPIVHRHERISPSPMLRAAMIAIGGQYSNDPSTKRKSRKLQDRCIKLFERREREPMLEPDRLCDHQAVFLVEILSQYRARRAAKTLSPRFGTLYHRVAENFRHTTTQITDIVFSLSRHENITLSRWLQWIELSTWQRLALSCYILESQQAILLAREPQSSLLQESGVDLPFPAHTLVWDALNHDDWAVAAQQYPASPQYVFEVTPGSVSPCCDSFQSSLLIAAHYNHFDSVTPYINRPSSEEIDHILDGSFATQQKVLLAKLLQVTPVRALLAVSGESWILSEKVPSQQAFTSLKTTLHTWVTQLWSAPTSDTQHVAVKEAIRISIQILQLALNTSSEAFHLDIGTEMGLYFAALVLWVATAAARARASFSQQILPRRNHLQSSVRSSQHGSTTIPSTSVPSPSSVINHPTLTSSPIQPSAMGLSYSQPTSPTRHYSFAAATLSHNQISLNSISFLSAMLSFVTTEPRSQSVPDLSNLQTACVSMLLWVKLQLRGVLLEDQGEMSPWTNGPGEGFGELLDSVIGSLERLLNRDWAECGI